MDKQVQRLSARRPVESFDEAALVLQQIIRAEMRGTVAATRVLSALRRVQVSDLFIRFESNRVELNRIESNRIESNSNLECRILIE